MKHEEVIDFLNSHQGEIRELDWRSRSRGRSVSGAVPSDESIASARSVEPDSDLRLQSIRQYPIGP